MDKYTLRDWVIYKITNPDNQVYVGCTSRINSRLSRYKNGHCKEQPLIFESLKKYGFDNHKIEIIDRFYSDKIYANGKEIFWIRTNLSDFTTFPEFNGLNASMGGSIANQLLTKESRIKAKQKFKDNPQILIDRGKKISKSMMGHTTSDESRYKNMMSAIQLRGVPVLMINNDGVVIKEYLSKSLAAKDLGVGETTLTRWLNNGMPKYNNVFSIKLK